MSLTLITPLLFISSIFYRYLRKYLAFSGTLVIESVVTFYSLFAWVQLGELRARDLILIKIISLIFFIIVNPKRFTIVSRFLKIFTNFKVNSIILILAVFVYFLFLISRSFMGNMELENIFIAIYVITAPIQGYLISFILDDVVPENKLGPLGLVIAALPALVLISLADFLALERLVLGSYAVGGLYSHFAIFCILLSKKKNELTIVLAFIVIGLLLFEVYIGGSRRYMLPILVLFFGSYLFLFNLTKKVILTSLAFLLIAPFGIFFASNTNSLDPNSEVETLQRGIGYRDVEFSFVLERIESIEHLVTGIGLGYQEKKVKHGSKGTTDVGPRLHNYYLTLFLNGGIVLLLLVVIQVISPLKYLKDLNLLNDEENKYNYLVGLFLVGWIISAWFDMPPDGLWPIGLCIYALGVLNKSESINS